MAIDSPVASKPTFIWTAILRGHRLTSLAGLLFLLLPPSCGHVGMMPVCELGIDVELPEQLHRLVAGHFPRA